MWQGIKCGQCTDCKACRAVREEAAWSQSRKFCVGSSFDFCYIASIPLSPHDGVSNSCGKNSSLYGHLGGTIRECCLPRGRHTFPKFRPTGQILSMPLTWFQSGEIQRAGPDKEFPCPRNPELLWFLTFLSLCFSLSFKSVGFHISLQ